ncbi:MAG: exosortase/archaeosortase family protein [Verrucomicrobia bacterium]|nr:exosortase/archaeosortase family protein [Verrucomicrobiota bacterium]
MNGGTMAGQIAGVEKRPSAMETLGTLVPLVPSLLAMAWLVSQAKWFWSTRPDLNFGWVVLILCCYLLWDACERGVTLEWRVRWWALAAGVAGAGLLFVVQVYQAAFGTNAASTQGLALGVLLICAANVGIAYGWRGVRLFAMPFAFILVSLPLPSLIQGLVVNGLQHRVAVIDTELLNLMGIPAQQVGSLIQLPNGTVGIDEACSGIRSLQSTVMASLFIGYLSLTRASLRVLLLVAGVLLAITGNVIRSLYLCLSAYHRGIDSISKVHDAAGWSILAFTAVGVILISWWFSRMEAVANRLAMSARREENDREEAKVGQAERTKL